MFPYPHSGCGIPCASVFPTNPQDAACRIPFAGVVVLFIRHLDHNTNLPDFPISTFLCVFAAHPAALHKVKKKMWREQARDPKLLVIRRKTVRNSSQQKLLVALLGVAKCVC